MDERVEAERGHKAGLSGAGARDPFDGACDPCDVLRATIAHCSDAIAVIDLDGRVLVWNPAAEELYGRSGRDTVGERLPHVAEDARLQAVKQIRSVAGSTDLHECDAVHVRGDGRRLPVSLSFVPIADADANPVGVLVLARAAGAGATRVAPMVEPATAMMCGLKSPLTAIAGYAQLLLRPEILGDTSRRARTIEALDKRVGNVAERLDTLCLLAQFDAGIVEAERHPVSIPALVADVASGIEHRSGTRLTIDYDPTLAPVTGDRALLERALQGLLGVATRFESPTRITASVARGSLGVSVQVGVSGPGPGDPLGELLACEKLLVAIEDERDALSCADVLLARVIAGAHGGALGVRRPPDGGFVFELELPI